MKPALIIVHIYYEHLWDEIFECLRDLKISYKLVITSNNLSEDLKSKIVAFNPETKFFYYENRGYDVGPFIDVIQKYNLDDFSYIIKFHTKRNIKKNTRLCFIFVKGKLWRNFLLNFAKNGNLDKSINFLEKNSSVGMIGDYRLILNPEIDYISTADISSIFPDFFDFSNKNLKFIAGTMFIVKANLFKEFEKLNLNINSFEKSTQRRQISMAHILERFFGYIVIKQGYEIVDPFADKSLIKKVECLHNLFSFCNKGLFKIYFNFIHLFFEARINSKNVYKIRVLRIPVYSKKMDD